MLQLSREGHGKNSFCCFLVLSLSSEKESYHVALAGLELSEIGMPLPITDLDVPQSSPAVQCWS